MKRLSYQMILYTYVALFSGCDFQPEYELPPMETTELSPEPNSNLKTAINAYHQAEKDIVTFDQASKFIVEAFVISSDAAGNFYKTLVVQDSPESPSRGVEIKLDLRSYYRRYNFGRKIFLDLAGLSMEEENGKYVIGYLSGGTLADIPEGLLNNHIIRSSETAVIVPRLIRFEEVSDNLLNTFVFIEGVQFLKEDKGKSFASEAYDRYNGERIVEQCDNLARSYLFTSTFANFKASLLPDRPIDLHAILTRDYYSGEVTLILNHPDDMKVSEKDRCDPLYFECADSIEVFKKDIIYFENFDRVSSSKDIENIGWKNINVNFNNGKFRKRSEDDNVFLQISAYGSNEYVMETWLISPAIDLDNSKEEYLTFDSRATFEEGSLLTVWLSSNFEGDIAKAEWHQLDAQVSVGSRDGSNEKFFRSGPIDLECLEGSIWLGFRYMGSDPGASTTYDLDNILILGEVPQNTILD